jgi:NADH:ubiquinone oxidoreductase subunit 5 (subunit L)/multisubunit Na+/H+ antiporter MnhA subunit
MFSALSLFAIAVMIMGWSVSEVFEQLFNVNLQKSEFVAIMLQAVGAIVIAIAIIDVSKYMIEEEIFRDKELRSPREARETMTKVIVIISIAVGIEGLVYIFKAGSENITLLPYPAVLLVVSVILIVGLGIFQKLSLSTEKLVRDPKPKD